MEEQQLEGTAEERAAKLEGILRCTIKKEHVNLRRGVYQRLVGTARCQACALGTLALSIGCKVEEDGWGPKQRRDMLDALATNEKARWLVTVDEANQLELGFEGIQPGSGDVHGGFTYSGVEPIATSPFYKLGQVLAKERT